MPSRDPRECPALEEALPVDDVPDGTWRADGSPLEVLFGDGSWRLVTVVARWEDRHGRTVVQIEWHAAGTTWGGEYVAAAGQLREAR
jgi:hypothetical protein